MKYINIFLLLAVAWLCYRTETKEPSVTYYHEVIRESQVKIDSLKIERTKIDTLIHENSNLIHGATRSVRDSLRAIYNPS